MWETVCERRPDIYNKDLIRVNPDIDEGEAIVMNRLQYPQVRYTLAQ